MGVFDKAASAFLSVVHVLSLIRTGGKRQSGETKLSVTVHEGKVGRQSQGKYLVTIRLGKVKMQTAKKKSDALIWEHSTSFVPWSPTDKLVLKLRKVNRCKDTTVGELSIDVAAALESADGLPQKWWYIMNRPSKGGRRNEDVFLQVSVIIDGTEVKSHQTQNQDPTKPPEETVEASLKGKPETLSELQNHQVKVVAASQETQADTPHDSSAKDSKPPSVARDIADVKLDSSDTTSDTASTSDTKDEFAANEDGDVVSPNDTHRSSRNTDVTPLQVSDVADGPGRERELPKGQDPAKTSEGTVKTELQEKPELENDKVNVSQEKAGRTIGQQRQGQLTTSRCRRRHRRQSSVFNKLGIRPTSHSSRYSRQTPCCRRRRCPRAPSFSCPWRTDGSTRQQRRGCRQSDDNVYSRRRSVSYNNHPIAQTPGRRRLTKTLTKSVQDEKERATYIKRWYWEELVRVALKEAPGVFGPED
ncbi:uncharacterized protein LOC144869901 [Branchiostoma floridae x Branchiostoma japonicum]